MSLFKHAMVSGINDALVDGGVVAWPDPSVGFEVASKIAADLDGPDMLPEGGLDPASALLIGNRLKEASDYIASQGYGPSAVGMLQTKQASSMDFADRAALVAEACMSKAAADASLTNVDKNTPESAARDDQHAALDQKNRATNKYLTGVGRTSFPSGGVVGAQQAWEGERIARNSLTALDKQAADTVLGVGPEALRLQAHRAGTGALDSLKGYAQSALKNPFAPLGAANRFEDFEMGGTANHPEMAAKLRAITMGDVGDVGKNLLKHPGTHAAAALAALYGGKKLYDHYQDEPKEGAFKWADNTNMGLGAQAAQLAQGARGFDPSSAIPTNMGLGGKAPPIPQMDKVRALLENAMEDSTLTHHSLAQQAAAAGGGTAHGLGAAAAQAAGPDLAAQARAALAAGGGASGNTMHGAGPEALRLRAHRAGTGALDSLKGYARSALSNPFAPMGAANRFQDFEMGGSANHPEMVAKLRSIDMKDVGQVGKNLLKHPGTHAAAALAALYGGKKLYDHYQDEPKEGAFKWANEDMGAGDLDAAADMTPGPTQGALQRSMMLLHGLKNRGYDPGPEAQVAAAGLGEAGEPGMEVMAHILTTVKTASEADDIIAQILHHQGQAGELASPELVEAIQQLMAQQQGPEMAPEAPKTAGARWDKLKAMAGGDNISNISHGLKARKLFEHSPDMQRALDKSIAKNVGALGGKALGATAAVGGAAYGGKKLYDKATESDEDSKAASLLSYLKAAADGSLTNVDKNTPESAAQTDQHAALDLKNRAAQAYLAGVGNTALQNGKQVYEIEHAPKQENRVDTSNLPTNETKSAELAYVNSFRKIAAELGPHLPATLSREEKIAHLQTMLGLPPGERVGYVKALRSA